MSAQLSFTPLAAADLGLVHAWLQRDHVRHWWSERETEDEVAEHYLPAIEGRDPTELYLIVLDGRPVGLVQTYLVGDYPEYAALVGVEADVAGVDLFIGEEELTGKGLGTEVLRAFVRDVVFARPATIACVADPDARNTASIRAFEKAGFAAVRTFVDPSGGATHTLVRRDRRPT